MKYEIILMPWLLLIFAITTFNLNNNIKEFYYTSYIVVKELRKGNNGIYLCNHNLFSDIGRSKFL